MYVSCMFFCNHQYSQGSVAANHALPTLRMNMMSDIKLILQERFILFHARCADGIMHMQWITRPAGSYNQQYIQYVQICRQILPKSIAWVLQNSDSVHSPNNCLVMVTKEEDHTYCAVWCSYTTILESIVAIAGQTLPASAVHLGLTSCYVNCSKWLHHHMLPHWVHTPCSKSVHLFIFWITLSKINRF